jgi:hypothetical protein
MVHQQQSHGKGKGKQIKNNNKSKQTTNFKKKKNKKEDEGCFVCGSPDHWIKKCPNRKTRNPQSEQRTMNMVTSTRNRTSRYCNLPYILYVFQSTIWWLDYAANVHVCSDASLFSSYQVIWDSSMMIGNRSHAVVHGVDMVDLKLTSEKIMQLKNMQHIPSISKNLVSVSLLYRDGFKVVLVHTET